MHRTLVSKEPVVNQPNILSILANRAMNFEVEPHAAALWQAAERFASPGSNNAAGFLPVV